MKKTVLAMALMAASGAAMAQSNVSIYGIVDLGFESTTASGERVNGIQSGLQSQSRIGIKGQEDLGNGLKAKFVLENGFDADNGAQATDPYDQSLGLGTNNSAFSRQAWLGLEGNFGEVRLGRQYAPMRQALGASDPFQIGGAGSISTIWNNGMFQEFVNNSVSYSLPAGALVDGLSATAMYGFGEQEESNSARQFWSIGAGYANKDLNVNAVYQSQNLDGVIGQKGSLDNWFVGGYYNFGVAKAHAALGESEFKQNGNKLKVRNYMVGVSVPMGQHTVMASYNVNDNRTFNNADSKQWAVGYQYDLSKRTNVYASYGHNSNNEFASINAPTGENSNTYQVGVRHAF